MTDIGYWSVLIIQLLLCAAIIAGSWLCFRRTRIWIFLMLGIFIGLFWPVFDACTNALLDRSMTQVLEGQTPALFPFSLMAPGDTGWTGWQMSPGEFVTKFTYAKHLLQYLLLAVLFALLAWAMKGVRLPEKED